MKRFMLAVSAVFLLLLALPRAGSAIDIGIGGLDLEIGGPPPVEITGPVELLPVPGRYVYFIPDIDADIFFYRDGWYRLYKGRWFRSDSYNGSWKHVRDVPPALIDLPPDYRSASSRFDRIPYRELRNNWERWEQERHWDRRRDEERRRYEERERERHEEMEQSPGEGEGY